MTRSVRNSTPLTLALLLLLGCAAPQADLADPAGAPIPSEDEDLVSPDDKTDTGYLSSLATELEGALVGELRLLADDEAREALTSEWARERLVTQQIKFGKAQLNAEQLHLNLSAGEMSDVTAREEGDEIVITYTMRVETIVTFEELREAGIEDPASLQDRAYTFRVPSDPRRVFERAGDACAEGHDEGSLGDYNYFYYFAPDKEGCEAALPIAGGTFTIHSLLPSSNTYPEYHRLVEDGRVETVAFYGAAGHADEVDYWDWGMREWREFTSALRSRGFREDGVADEDTGKGKRFIRTREGLEEVVDVISPEDLHALNDDTDGLFGRMVRSHEIVLYLGHSFYGSLGVLDDPETYAPDEYQVFFIGSCWSYEYYTKQIFRNKANATDPTGWALADVVNDTETGWFHNNAEFSRILLTNLLAGAEHGGRDGSRSYHWQGIIEAMNEQALTAQRQRGTDTHEIMGVSGVRTNRFDPDAPPPPPVEEWETLSLGVESAHPYADDLSQTFEVEAPEGTTSMRLHFEQLDVEAGYDAVEIYDAAGALVARFDGTHSNVYTPDIPGARATVKLVSDFSVTKWGFRIDHLLHRSGDLPPPADWTAHPITVASPHDYTNDMSESYEVTAPADATSIRLHFSRLETEARYDWVEVYDGSGTLVARYDGSQLDVTTPEVQGSRATIKLVTDYSVTAWGFELDRVDYR